MSDGVHANIAAIRSMEAACAQFARAVVDRLPAVERQLRLASEALNDRSDDLQREVFTLNDEISSADEDDDTSWARNRVEEAEEELASVQRRIRRLADAGAGLNAQARKVNHLATDHAIRTREFLREAVDDLLPSPLDSLHCSLKSGASRPVIIEPSWIRYQDRV